MLKKRLSLIITFQETVQAMAVERLCMNQRLPGRLIPVPREITAGCGLAWKSSPEDERVLCTALKKAGLIWSETYILEV